MGTIDSIVTIPNGGWQDDPGTRRNALAALEDHLACRLTRIGLTVVDQPVEEIGREAARTALELIRDPSSGPIHRVIRDCAVVDRRTTRGEKEDDWIEGTQGMAPFASANI